MSGGFFNDDDDDFFSELDLDEIMALEQAASPPEENVSSSDKENTGPLLQLSTAATPLQRLSPLPLPSASAAVTTSARGGGGGGVGVEACNPPSSTPLGSAKKRFKFFKSAPTPVRLQPPSPVPDVSVIEFDDDEADFKLKPVKGKEVNVSLNNNAKKISASSSANASVSRMSGAFNDDDDDFFSELDLDEIMALEQAAVNVSSSEKEDTGPLLQLPTAATPLKRLSPLPLPSASAAVTTSASGGGFGETCHPPSSTNKRFKFFKPAPTPVRLQHPSPVPDVSVIELDDDDGFKPVKVKEANVSFSNAKKISASSSFTAKVSKISAGPSTGFYKAQEISAGPSASFNNAKKINTGGICLNPQKVSAGLSASFNNAKKINACATSTITASRKKTVFDPRIIDNEEDREWKQFVRDFEAQSISNNPSFQTIPITAQNISRCRSSLSSVRETAHLIQLSRMIFSFLKQLAGFTGGVEGAEIDVVSLDRGYFNDLIQLLELAFVQLDKRKNEGSADGIAQTTEFMDLMKEVSEQYILGKLDLGTTRIPELLASLHPLGFTEILQSVRASGNIDLLLPLCSRSQENFMTILNFFLFYNSSDSEEDPDFQIQPPQRSPSTSKLLINLLKSLFSFNSLNVLPYQFQPLVSFECVLGSQHPSLFSRGEIINELYSILNDTICQCERDGVDEKLLRFLFSTLPETSRVLNNKTSTKKIKFKEYPYLWKYLRQHR